MPDIRSNLEPGIRNAARAVILRNHNVLMLHKNNDGATPRYALPGGAQEPGETIADALKRECREEIGCDVTLGRLLLVADFFKQRDTQPPRRRQLLELLYRCEIPSDYQPRNGPRPDKHQIGVAWVPLENLQGLTVTPSFLGDFLNGDLNAPARYTEHYADPRHTNERR